MSEVEARMLPGRPGLWWGSWVGGPPEPFHVRTVEGAGNEAAEAEAPLEAIGLLGPPVEAVPASDARFIWFAPLPGPAVAASLARLDAAIREEIRLSHDPGAIAREWQVGLEGEEGSAEAQARWAYQAACEEVDVASDKLRDAICALHGEE